MKRVRPSRPAPVRSLSTPRQYLVITHGIPPAFRDGVRLSYQPPLGQSQVDHITQLRAGGVHCRESSGDLKVVQVRGLPIQETRLTHFCASLFSHSHHWYDGHMQCRQCRRRDIKYTSTRNVCMYVVMLWCRQAANRKRLYVPGT